MTDDGLTDDMYEANPNPNLTLTQVTDDGLTADEDSACATAGCDDDRGQGGGRNHGQPPEPT